MERLLKAPEEDILEHNHKRGIELKLLILEDKLKMANIMLYREGKFLKS